MKRNKTWRTYNSLEINLGDIFAHTKYLNKNKGTIYFATKPKLTVWYKEVALPVYCIMLASIAIELYNVYYIIH